MAHHVFRKVLHYRPYQKLRKVAEGTELSTNNSSNNNSCSTAASSSANYKRSNSFHGIFNRFKSIFNHSLLWRMKLLFLALTAWLLVLILLVLLSRKKHIRLPEDLPLLKPTAAAAFSSSSSTSTNTQSQDGCALLFFGLPRRFLDLCLPSVREHLLQHNPNCDIFVHTYNVTGNVGTRLGETQDGRIQPGDVYALTNHVVMDTEEEFQQQRDLEYYRQFFPRPSSWEYPFSMDNMIRQWHSIERVWGLMEQAERQRGKQYQQVGYFRIDVQYHAPIDIYSGDAVVPVEHFDTPTMQNDRMFFGKRDYAQVWGTRRFSSVPIYIQAQQEWQDSLSWWNRWTRMYVMGIHSEQYLYYILNNVGRVPVQTRNVCFMRVRTSGYVVTKDCNERTRAKAAKANLVSNKKKKPKRSL